MGSDSVRKPLHIPGKRLVLTKNMILESQKQTRSASEASRWLKVSYSTYKKWAKYYGVFEQHLNQEGVGIKKGFGKYRISMEDVFNGKSHPHYTFSMIKKRLLEGGWMQEECSMCEWNEERITDSKVCLNLDFVDGDSDNKSLENMRLLCPNCYLSNNGLFQSSKNFCK